MNLLEDQDPGTTLIHVCLLERNPQTGAVELVECPVPTCLTCVTLTEGVVEYQIIVGQSAAECARMLAEYSNQTGYPVVKFQDLAESE